jgi:hypothetical protein
MTYTVHSSRHIPFPAPALAANVTLARFYSFRTARAGRLRCQLCRVRPPCVDTLSMLIGVPMHMLLLLLLLQENTHNGPELQINGGTLACNPLA